MNWQRQLKRLLDSLIILLVIWLLLAAAYVSLGRQFVPAVAEYRTELVSWAEELSGRAILLEGLSGEMQGSQPVLALRGLQVHAEADTNSPVLFALDSVVARIDVFASLWQQRLVMDALQIDGLTLELVEDEQGHWQLYGLGDRRTGSQGRDAALQVLFDQRRITLLDTRIKISPFEQPEWQFEEGELTLLNRANSQRLDGRVRLPDGQLISWQVQNSGSPGDWEALGLDFYLELPALDWSERLPAAWLARAHIDQMIAGGRFWGRWDAQQLQHLQAQLIAPHVQMTLVEPLPEIRDLLANVTLNWPARQLQVEGLTLRLDEHLWPQTRLLLSREGAEGGWDLRLDKLPLAPLADLLHASLSNEQVREAIATLAPQGYLRQVRLQAGSQLQDLDALSLQARLDKVGIQPYKGVPGFSGISGSLAGTPAAGEVRLNSADWGMHLPNLFPDAWNYDAVQGALSWQWSQEAGLQLSAPGMRVSGVEGAIAARLNLHLPRPEAVPTMSLQVSLQDTRADVYQPYLPTLAPAFPARLSDWLADAEVQGQVPLAVFNYEGSLLKGATPEERQINLYVQVQQGSLNVQPGWPRIEQVEARLYLNSGVLSIEDASAQMLDTRLGAVQIHTERPDPEQPSRLHVQTAFDGSLENALTLLQDTSLAQASGNILTGWRGQGALQGDLAIILPLQAGSRPAVRVEWQADVSRLDIPQLQSPLEAIKGRFAFDLESGLSAEQVSMRFLGQPVTASAAQQQGAQGIRLEGVHSVSSLRSWSLLPALPDGLLEGDLAWQSDLQLLPGEMRLQVSSELHSVSLALPGRLAKAAGSRWPSSLMLTQQGDRRGWRFNLGPDLRGELKQSAAQLQGDIRLATGEPQVTEAEGLTVQARFEHFDLPTWQALLGSLPSRSANDTAASSAQPLAGQWLHSLDLRASRFSGLGQELDDLGLSAIRTDQGWLLDLDQSRIRGQVVLPDTPGSRMMVNLQRLHLNKPEQPQVEEAVLEPMLPEDPLRQVRPETIPSADVSIDQLYWGAEPVGAVSFNLRTDAEGLRADALQADLRGLQLSGDLAWRSQDRGSRFNGKVQATDIGAVLQAWGFAPTLTSSSFNTDVALQWPGSPAFFALSRSSGDLQLDASDGSLQSGEGSADALRVFGLLNFNALTRRLRLDFSDLFGRGTAYDSLTGSMRFTDGVMQTRNPLVMDGPGAKLQLEGSLNLPTNQVDMGMLVTLPVTNNLPLAAIIAGAPYIGGALFIADKILGDRVARFASVKYKISGDWQQPTIEFDRAFDSKAALEEN